MKEFKGTPALDAGLLAGAQAVEHYEISGYGTLKTWAPALGMGEAAAIAVGIVSGSGLVGLARTAMSFACPGRRASSPVRPNLNFHYTQPDRMPGLML